MISQHFFAFFRHWDSHRLDERELNTSKRPPSAPSRSGPRKELEENHRQPGRLRAGVLISFRRRRKTSRRRPGPRRNAGDHEERGYSVHYQIEFSLSLPFLRPVLSFFVMTFELITLNAQHFHGLDLHLHRRSHELPDCTTASR